MKTRFSAKVYWALSLMFFCTLGTASRVNSARPLSQNDTVPPDIVISSIAWSPDGTQIAVGKGQPICATEFNDPAFAIQIIDPNGQPLGTLLKPRCLVQALAWSSDGRELISGGVDVSLMFWDMVEKQFVRAIGIAWGGPEDIVLSQNGQKIYILEQASLYEYDIQMETVSADFPDQKTKQVTSFALSPNDQQLAAGDMDGFIRIINAANRQNLQVLEQQSAPITALAWSPDGQQIVSGTADGSLSLWDAIQGEPLLGLSDHKGEITRVKWHPDSNLLASASYDGSVRIWDLNTGLSESYPYEGPVLALDWSPDGQYLAYGGGNRNGQNPQVEIETPQILTPNP